MKEYNNPSGSNEQDRSSGAGEDPKSLHQGQGPDFQTQDPELKKQNEGVKALEKKREKPATDKGKEDYENVGEGDASLEVPGQDPEETPQMK
jgi:hypothetical protein